MAALNSQIMGGQSTLTVKGGANISEITAHIVVNWMDSGGKAVSTTEYDIPVWNQLSPQQQDNMQDIRNTIAQYVVGVVGCKAQIAAVELDGRHNKGLDASRARILKGASWKRQRIIVLLPSPDLIPAKVALSHWNLIFPPNNAVYRMLCLGLEVGEAYCQGIEAILGHPDLSKWEYILTLEADNAPPADGVLQLCESMDKHPEYSCIGGLYWTKFEGGVPQIWGDPTDPVLNFRPQVPVPNTVQECCGTGMGFNLWRIKMFHDKRLRRPWFKTVAGREGCVTQDLYAWSDFRKYGYRCAIDTRILVGHFDQATDTFW